MGGPEIGVATGASKPETAGVLKPYQIGEASARLLSRGTGSAMDGGEGERKITV